MPTKSVIELLQFGHNTASKILPWVKLNIQKINNRYFVVANTNTINSSKIIWTIVLLTSFVVTLAEVYKNLYQSKPVNLVTLFYHIFLLLSKVAGLISVYVYQTKHKENSILLHCFCTRPNGFVAFSCERLKSHNYSFPIIVALISIAVLLFYAAILPIVFSLLPCLHEDFKFTSN